MINKNIFFFTCFPGIAFANQEANDVNPSQKNLSENVRAVLETAPKNELTKKEKQLSETLPQKEQKGFYEEVIRTREACMHEDAAKYNKFIPLDIGKKCIEKTELEFFKKFHLNLIEKLFDKEDKTPIEKSLKTYFHLLSKENLPPQEEAKKENYLKKLQNQNPSMKRADIIKEIKNRLEFFLNTLKDRRYECVQKKLNALDSIKQVEDNLTMVTEQCVEEIDKSFSSKIWPIKEKRPPLSSEEDSFFETLDQHFKQEINKMFQENRLNHHDSFTEEEKKFLEKDNEEKFKKQFKHWWITKKEAEKKAKKEEEFLKSINKNSSPPLGFFEKIKNTLKRK